jgi:hypothetical protein
MPPEPSNVRNLNNPHHFACCELWSLREIHCCVTDL